MKAGHKFISGVKLSDFSFLKNKNIIVALVATTLYDATFVVSTVNIMISEIANSNVLLFYYLVLRKLIRTIADIPMARLIDKKISIKNAIVLALFLKAIFILTIPLKSKALLFFGIFCEGISLAFFRGKASVFQYRVMQLANQEEHYPLLNTLVTFLIYAFTIINSFIGAFLVYKRSILTACLATDAAIIIALVCALTVKIQPASSSKNQQRPVAKRFNASISSISLQIFFCSVMLGICGLGWELNTLNQFLTLKLTQNPIYASEVFEYNSIAMMMGAVAAMFLRNQGLRSSSYIFISILLINTFLPIFVGVKGAPLVILTYSFFFNAHDNILRTNIIRNTTEEQQCLAMSISTTITSVLTILTQAIFMLGGQFIKPIFTSMIIFGILSVLAISSGALMARANKNT